MMMRMVMGMRGRRPARPAVASIPGIIREQYLQLQPPVGKLAQSMNKKRAKKEGLIPPRKSAEFPTHCQLLKNRSLWSSLH